MGNWSIRPDVSVIRRLRRMHVNENFKSPRRLCCCCNTTELTPPRLDRSSGLTLDWLFRAGAFEGGSDFVESGREVTVSMSTPAVLLNSVAGENVLLPVGPIPNRSCKAGLR